MTPVIGKSTQIIDPCEVLNALRGEDELTAKQIATKLDEPQRMVKAALWDLNSQNLIRLKCDKVGIARWRIR